MPPPVANVDQTQALLSIIRALDAGIRNHETWFVTLHESLVCDSPHPNPTDLQDDAHQCCKFGQWYYDIGNKLLGGDTDFQHIGPHPPGQTHLPRPHHQRRVRSIPVREHRLQAGCAQPAV